jgi:hypothetical protein
VGKVKELTGVLQDGFLRDSQTSCCLRDSKQTAKLAGGSAPAATGKPMAGAPEGFLLSDRMDSCAIPASDAGRDAGPAPA